MYYCWVGDVVVIGVYFCWVFIWKGKFKRIDISGWGVKWGDWFVWFVRFFWVRRGGEEILVCSWGGVGCGDDLFLYGEKIVWGWGVVDGVDGGCGVVGVV